MYQGLVQVFHTQCYLSFKWFIMNGVDMRCTHCIMLEEYMIFIVLKKVAQLPGRLYNIWIIAVNRKASKLF